MPRHHLDFPNPRKKKKPDALDSFVLFLSGNSIGRDRSTRKNRELFSSLHFENEEIKERKKEKKEKERATKSIVMKSIGSRFAGSKQLYSFRKHRHPSSSPIEAI